MFEKNKNLELYQRQEYSMEEKLFKKHIEMRKIVKDIEKQKYNVDDSLECSDEYKQGFIAGVKTLASIIFDL